MRNKVQQKSDSLFMQIALEYAWNFQTLTLPNPCVGSLILYHNSIIALQAHYKAGSPHAEVLACKEAFLYLLCNDTLAQEKILTTLKKERKYYERKDFEILQSCKISFENMQDSQQIFLFLQKYHSNVFQECEIFVTLEPCNHYGKTPPCASLLQTIKPKRVIIGHIEENPQASGGIQTLHHIILTTNVLQQKISDLLYPFLQWQKKQCFTLFKIANRLNGDYKHGIISNYDSRIFTHNMRCVADCIIVSGKTLREDNPLLDTRYAIPPYSCWHGKENKLPEIYVLSKTMTLTDLQDYKIAHRKVKIIQSIQEIPQFGFNIIEGGFEFLYSILQELESCNNKSLLDCIMGYIAPSLLKKTFVEIVCQQQDFQETKNNNILEDFALCHVTAIKDFWSKQKGVLLQENKHSSNILYWLFHTKTSYSY